ncbi:hypothetical protein P308_26405 [Pseudomonas piscis]|nr:hypothetical protein P308_26405 [Pseudomonas piscis]
MRLFSKSQANVSIALLYPFAIKSQDIRLRDCIAGPAHATLVRRDELNRIIPMI